MAGAVFGEVGVSLFVAGAALREIWIVDSRSAKYFSIQNASPRSRWDESGLRSGGCEMTISWSDVLGMSSQCRRIVFISAEAIQGLLAEILNSEFRGRRSTW